MLESVFFGLAVGSIMKSLINTGIVEFIPLLFSDVIEYVSLSGGGYIDKNNIFLLMEDDNLVYVHHE